MKLTKGWRIDGTNYHVFAASDGVVSCPVFTQFDFENDLPTPWSLDAEGRLTCHGLVKEHYNLTPTEDLPAWVRVVSATREDI